MIHYPMTLSYLLAVILLCTLQAMSGSWLPW